MQLVGKLTPKALGWDRVAIGAAVKTVPATGRILLGRVGGIVGGFKETVSNETGEIQRGLKGQFRGTSEIKDEAGETIAVTAGVCYLPGGIQEMIEGALMQAQDVTNGGSAKATVTFLLDLYAIPATNKAGYSFTAETLKEAGAVDPLTALFDSVKPMLEAPAENGDAGAAIEPAGDAGEKIGTKAGKA